MGSSLVPYAFDLKDVARTNVREPNKFGGVGKKKAGTRGAIISHSPSTRGERRTLYPLHHDARPV